MSRPPSFPGVTVADFELPRVRRMTVLFDEADDPLQMVSGAIFSTSYSRTEAKIEDLYERLCESYYYLDGHSGFERFKRKGFHSTDQPREIHTHLVDLLSGIQPIRIFILYTDGSRRPDLTKIQTTAILYRELIRTVLQACAGMQEVELVFEQNQQLDARFQRIVTSAARGLTLHFKAGLYLGMKKKPHALSVADYAMHAFGRWHTADRTTDPRRSEYSQWRAIRTSIAMVRSLEGGPVLRRGLAVQ